MREKFKEVSKEDVKKLGKTNPNDFLQPGDPRFKKVYGHDPYTDQKKAEKKEKTETQDSLERKYWHMKKQGSITPDQERTLRKEVLKGGGVVDEILQRRLNK